MTMTKEEYIAKKREISERRIEAIQRVYDKYNGKVETLNMKYAKDNLLFRAGNIIRRGSCRILIDAIHIDVVGPDAISVSYGGRRVRKDGTFITNGDYYKILQAGDDLEKVESNL